MQKTSRQTGCADPFSRRRNRRFAACSGGLFKVLLFTACLLGPFHLMAQHDVAAGAKNFSTNCSGCHGSDGRGGERAPNIATARNISSLSDEDLVRIVQHGVAGAGMPSFTFLGDAGVANVVAYVRVLQGKTSGVVVSGDAVAGEKLFFGTAQCAACHMVHGKGGFIASDLSGYGSGMDPESVRKAIVEQPAVVPEGSQVVEFVTSSGEQRTAVLRSEDNFNVMVQYRDGKFQRLDKTLLRRLTYTGHTLMPTDYGKRLTSQQVDDLVSYLVHSADGTTPATHRHRESDE